MRPNENIEMKKYNFLVHCTQQGSKDRQYSVEPRKEQHVTRFLTYSSHKRYQAKLNLIELPKCGISEVISLKHLEYFDYLEWILDVKCSKFQPNRKQSAQYICVFFVEDSCHVGVLNGYSSDTETTSSKYFISNNLRWPKINYMFSKDKIVVFTFAELVHCHSHYQYPVPVTKLRFKREKRQQ